MPTVIESTKNETKCTLCGRVFWAWDSGRTDCYVCDPRIYTTEEARILRARREN